MLLPPPNPLLYPMQAMSDNPSAFPFADFDADLSLFDLLGAVDAGAGSGLDFLPALVGPLDMEEPTPNLAGSLANDLEDALGWEKGLLASGTGADTLVEVRNFASQWWTFCTVSILL